MIVFIHSCMQSFHSYYLYFFPFLFILISHIIIITFGSEVSDTESDLNIFNYIFLLCAIIDVYMIRDVMTFETSFLLLPKRYFTCRSLFLE